MNHLIAQMDLEPPCAVSQQIAELGLIDAPMAGAFQVLKGGLGDDVRKQ